MPGILVEKNCVRFVGRYCLWQVVPANTTGSHIRQKPRPNLNNPVRNFMCQTLFVFKKQISLKSFWGSVLTSPSLSFKYLVCVRSKRQRSSYPRPWRRMRCGMEYKIELMERLSVEIMLRTGIIMFSLWYFRELYSSSYKHCRKSRKARVKSLKLSRVRWSRRGAGVWGLLFCHIFFFISL